MVEDESKEKLIGALKANLEQQPAVNGKNTQFQNDNIQVKLDT
jgi:hypothetical protein